MRIHYMHNVCTVNMERRKKANNSAAGNRVGQDDVEAHLQMGRWREPVRCVENDKAVKLIDYIVE